MSMLLFARQDIEVVTAPVNIAVPRPNDEAGLGLMRMMSTTTGTGTSCDESIETSSSNVRSGSGIRLRTRGGRTATAATGRVIMTSGGGDGDRRPAVSRAKVKTVKLTIAVVLSYLICWFPYFMTQLWAVWDETAPFEG